jgi:hypothetical protein
MAVAASGASRKESAAMEGAAAARSDLSKVVEQLEEERGARKAMAEEVSRTTQVYFFLTVIEANRPSRLLARTLLP